MERWRSQDLASTAVAVSASRRTDIPALFAEWFRHRLREGVVEYIPAGPPRRVRRSLAPRDVTHFNFWTKWPRPFLSVLDEVLARGFPTLWNVTLTGLGGTPLEPGVPTQERVLASLEELSQRVGAGRILWRFDPLLLTDQQPPEEVVERFCRLADRLSGKVDRVATSFVTCYGRRVKPDLERFYQETGTHPRDRDPEEEAELIRHLAEEARQRDLELTLCCSPGLRSQTGRTTSGCNSWEWACRAYPELESFRGLRTRPCREDCACSQEIDIGCYDTCILGCRYSYGSASQARARVLFERHDPLHPCLVPPPPEP